jgi:Ca2+-binding EF-hand superfamily protein
MVRLSDEQIKQLVETFYNLDADADDFLTVEETFALFETLRLIKGPDRLTEVLNACDLEQKGRLDKKDILRVCFFKEFLFVRSQNMFTKKSLKRRNL